MKKGLFVALFITLLSFGSQNVEAAGCGVFYIHATDIPTCRNEHCGIWDSRALVQTQYKKRRCVRDDNSTYWEYGSNRVHLSCNC